MGKQIASMLFQSYLLLALEVHRDYEAWLKSRAFTCFLAFSKGQECNGLGTMLYRIHIYSSSATALGLISRA